MNNIEILENCWLMKTNHVLDEENKKVRQAIKNLIQENKELKEKINKSIEFINDDDIFFCDGESWQNVLHIERILKGE